MNAKSNQRWWSTRKFVVFGLNFSLPQLVGVVVDRCTSLLVRLICCQIIFTASTRRCRLICRSHYIASPSLITFAIRSNEFRRPLLGLCSYGGTDPFGIFPLFVKSAADVLVSLLIVVFRVFYVCVVSLLAGHGRISPQFRKVDSLPLFPITDQFPLHQYTVKVVWASGVGASRTIYWIAVVSYNDSVCLSERSGTCDTLLCVSHILQSALETGEDSRSVADESWSSN